MLQIFRALSAVLLLVMIALVSALITMRLAIHGAEVQVPVLRGRTVPQAVVELRAKGLQAGIDGHYYSATQPAGVVITQSPVAGTLVRKSWRVRMTVSLGPQKVAIPSVDGMNETIATITIRRMGLQVGAVVGLPYAYAPENTVIAQTPTGQRDRCRGSARQHHDSASCFSAGQCQCDARYDRREFYPGCAGDYPRWL